MTFALLLVMVTAMAFGQYTKKETATFADSVVSKLVSMNEDALVPIDYFYIIPHARIRYEVAKKAIPEKWTIVAVLRAYSSRQDLVEDIQQIIDSAFKN